jgi:hypothetical protein
MSEHLIGGGVAFERQEPCKVNRVTFFNGNAAAKGVSFSYARLPSTESKFTLVGAPGITSQYDLGGFSFPDGFTVYPTDVLVTNIIVEYEDVE